MKITAIFAVTQGFCPGEGHFFQAAVGHVVGIAEDVAQLRAVVLDAGSVPEAFCDGYIEGSAGVILCTFMQVGGAHDFSIYFWCFRFLSACGTAAPAYRIKRCPGLVLIRLSEMP